MLREISLEMLWECSAFQSNNVDSSGKVSHTESALYKEKPWKQPVLTEEKLHVGIQLEASFIDSLCVLALQCGMSRSMLHVTVKLLKLQPYKMGFI
jgi:hypothetical protein